MNQDNLMPFVIGVGFVAIVLLVISFWFFNRSVPVPITPTIVPATSSAPTTNLSSPCPTNDPDCKG